ncbi:MAG: cell division protein FtsH, partial [Nodosilinea sp.]
MKTETTAFTHYGTFLSQVKDSQVQRVMIKAHRIDYTLLPQFGGEGFYTTPVGSGQELLELLRHHGVSFTLVPDTLTPGALWGLALSSGVLVGALALALKLSTSGGQSMGLGSAVGMGRSQARSYGRSQTKVTFADVAG